MELPLRAVPGDDRGAVASGIRRYVEARSVLHRTIAQHPSRRESHIARAAALGDTHHSARAWDFVASVSRPLLAERIAGGAGLAVFLSDWLALSSSRFRELHTAGSAYLGSVLDTAGAARCLDGPPSTELTRRALIEFGAAGDLYVRVRTEQLTLERRGVTRASVDQIVRASRRATVSLAAIVSEIVTLETDLVALA